MSDEELIKAVAELWVDNGGDVDGLAWLHNELIGAVREEIDSRKGDEDEPSQ